MVQLGWLAIAPSACPSSDISWASASPTSVTNTPGTSTPIDVTFNSVGLTPGNTYTGTLCVTSNDPLNSLVRVPLTMTVQAQPSLLITKTVELANDPAQRGDPITYTIVVANSGGMDASNTRITDTLPTYVNGTNLSQTVTVTASDRLTFTINATVDSGVPYDEVITNSAYYSHTSGTGQDSITLTVQSTPPALAITKTVELTNNPAQRGDPITYILSFSNAGGSTASGVVITDAVPVSVTHSSLSFSSSGATITPTGSISYVWNVKDLSPGQGGIITITGVLSDPLATGTFTNTATITTTSVDSDTNNNTNSAGVTVVVVPPVLSIDKSTQAEPNTSAALYHGLITYTVTITNSSNGDATGALFTDTLPGAKVDFAHFISPPTPGNAAEGSDEITWSGTVTANSVITFSYVVTHVGNYGETFTNTAQFLHPTTSQSGTVSTAVTIASSTPVLQSIYPPRNVVTASLTTTVTATYNHNIDANTVTRATFAIHGMQSGLVMKTHGVVNGNTLRVTPTNSFHQGELVYAIATTHTTNISGTAPLSGMQWQFNAGLVNNRCLGGFSQHSIAPTGVYRGSVAWGDYDNDGDLDILLAGLNSSFTRVTEVWRNNGGGSFSLHSTAPTGVQYSSVAWGDYDNDGDLDILLAGDSGSGRVTEVWRNNGGGSFSLHSTAPTGVWFSSVAWGDYDNDGDLDILLAGFNSAFIRVTEVWGNDGGGNFSLHSTAPTGVSSSSVAWGDYDNDSDLDILLAGYSSGGYVTEVWGNNGGGSFSLHSTAPTGVYDSSVAWGDYDNDGNLDILLAGYSSAGYETEVWGNDGGGSFSQHSTAPTGVSSSSVAWGDYDNDGDLDILLAGDSGSGYVTEVWGNDDCLSDLSISKVVTPSPAQAGQTITYTLSFSNTGTGTASGVVITDAVPVSVTHSSLNFSSSGATITPTGSISYVWNVEDLSPGQGGIITITGILSDPLAAGTFTNTATIATTSVDSDMNSNTAEAVLLVPPPVLSIDKSAQAEPNTSAALYHGLITYTVTITNSGNGDAVGALFTDTLPGAKIDFAHFISPPTPGSAAENSDIITWSGTVTANSVITFSYVVTHVGNYGETFNNTAQFLHPTTSQSGTVSTAVTIASGPDVVIDKTLSQANAAPGETVTYILRFSNTGGSPAVGVVITDAVPVSVTHSSLSSSSSGATITPTGSISYVWNVEDLSPGEWGIITITGVLSDPLAAGRFTNTTTIATTSVDSDTNNNTNSAGVTVVVEPALVIGKSTQAVPSAGAALYHGLITYTVTITNSGNGDAAGALFTDTLPGAKVDFAHFISPPTPGNAAENSDIIIWSGTVTANSVITFSYVVTHVGNYGETFTNTAQFLHPTTSQSGTVSTAVTIVSGPDLSITKRVELTNDPAQRGDPITYTIVVVNNGGMDATNTRITDTLPTYVNGSGLDQTATITAADRLTFTIKATVDSGVPYDEVITNNAYYSHTSGFGQDSITFSLQSNPARPNLSINTLVGLTHNPAQPGDPITYTIVVANSGDLDATNVRITDSLPNYVNGSNPDHTVTVTAGDSVTVNLKVTLDNNVPDNEIITNTAYYAHISGSGQDSVTFTSASDNNYVYLPILLKTN